MNRHILVNRNEIMIHHELLNNYKTHDSWIMNQGIIFSLSVLPESYFGSTFHFIFIFIQLAISY